MPYLKHEKKNSAESRAAGPGNTAPRIMAPRGRKRPLLLALAILLISSWLLFLAVLALGGY
jgi:hypothetical protein